METRTSRKHVSPSISSVSGSERRSISHSPKRGPSTPMKSSIQRDDSEDEHDPNDRDSSPLVNNSKAMMDQPSSPTMSDTEDNHRKKRSHHRHRHHHHKQPKSNKRSAPQHKHSVKRSKKETVTAIDRRKSDEDNSSEKNTSESEQSLSEQEILSSDSQSNDEEEIVKDGGTSNERRTHLHRKNSSNRERHSSSAQSSSNPIPKNNKGTQLIVNYLPSSLRESDFYQLFARIAPIKLCKLITDRQTGHSFCYGFIEYHSREDAVKAIEKYNGYRIEHKKLKVSYAQPKAGNNDEEIEVNTKYLNSSSTQKNSNIYITDLPDDFDEKMLERLFSKYGEIIQTKILRDPRTKISRGVAFVLMTSTRSAERAVKALDGYVPSGANRPISVKYADPKKTTSASNEPTSRPSNRMETSIGPYGYPPALSSMSMMDPYYAAAAFHHHRATMNMRNLSPSPPPSSSYYGSGNHRTSRVRGSSPGLPRSYSSSKHILNTPMNNSPPGLNSSNTASLAAACDLIAKGCQQAIDPNGFVIYAFGLPHDCDENDLEELFRRYGEVYRVYIVRNYSTGESKGYSFVTMRNYEEACHAVERLDSSTFKGRTIQVRFKQ